MTRPTTTGKAQDLITFTRSTTGTALAKISYGEELVTNGDFSSDSNWNKNPNWTISNGAAISDGSTSQNMNQGTVTSVVNKPYLLSVTLSSLSQGSVTVTFGGAASLNASSTGTHSLLVIPASSDRIRIYASDFAIASIDNISVKEVLYDQPDGTLQLFNHPINKPRIEYDAEGNCLGLLVEEARTNQAKHSKDWTLYPWTLRENSFSSSTNSIAPDGTAGATRFYTNSNVPAFLQQSCGGNVGAKTHTVSCWVRSTNGGADQTFRLKCTHSGVTDFFSNDKTATSEWKRFTFTETFISASNTAVIAGVVEDSSTNQFDIEVWGMQVEFDASFPTSYIPTSGSAVTRSADVASLAVSEFGYNQDQGTVFINCLITEQPDFNLRVIDGNSNNKRWMYVNAPDNNYGLKYYDGTNNPTLVSSGIPPNMKAAVAVTPTQVFGAANSSAVGSGAHNGTLLDISQFNFFSTLNGHIKSVQYYPLRLSNAQLQALTS